MRHYLIISMLFISFAACKKATTEPNQSELITTVELSFTEQGGTGTSTFKWEDLDGPGGAAPVINTINLTANKTYQVVMRMYDKTKTPAVLVSGEIIEEGASHRVYYQTQSGSNITITTTDVDANNLPLGLTSTWTTTAAANGKVKITLRHYPSGGKAADDLVNSNKSTTDVEVEMPTVVQ